MNPFIIACLLAFIFSLANAVFIFLSRPFNFLKILWGLISIIVAISNISLFLMMTASFYATAYRYAFTVNFVVIFIPVLFFHFTSILTNYRRQKNLELKIYYGLTLLYMGLVILFPGNFLSGVGPIFELKYYTQSGPLYCFLPLWFVYLVSYGLILVYRHYHHATAIKKNQLKYFFIGCSFGAIGGVSAFLPALGIPVRPWGLCLLPLYVWIVSYAIVKHQLMDIKIILRKSLVYTILISLLTVIFFILIYAAEKMSRHMIGYKSGMDSVFAIACITLLVVPVYRLLQSLIDRMFYKGTVGQFAQENRRLHEEMLLLESNRTLREIARTLVLEIQEPLKRIKEHSQDKLAIKDDVNYVQKIIADLWEYSETVPKNYSEVNLIPLLDQTMSKISIGHTNNNRIFKYYQSFKSVKILGSEEQLGRCFNYIFTYSLNAIEKGGEIFIALEHNKEWVSISIRHNAYILSEQEAENIFKPFFKSENIRCGLSLALAHAIILQHGGKIKLDIQENAGVDFLIDLPLS